MRAASSSRRSTASIDSRIARTHSGSAITAAAIAAPVQRNSTLTPNQPCNQAPTAPAGANSSSSTHPVTTGGTTRGRCTTASSSSLPANRPRASTQASANATGSTATVATPPTSSVRRTIAHSSPDRIILPA